MIACVSWKPAPPALRLGPFHAREPSRSCRLRVAQLPGRGGASALQYASFRSHDYQIWECKRRWARSDWTAGDEIDVPAALRFVDCVFIQRKRGGVGDGCAACPYTLRAPPPSLRSTVLCLGSRRSSVSREQAGARAHRSYRYIVPCIIAWWHCPESRVPINVREYQEG